MGRIGAGLGALRRLLLLLGVCQHRGVLGLHTRLELEPSGLGQRLGLCGVLGEHLEVEAQRARRVPGRLERLGLGQGAALLGAAAQADRPRRRLARQPGAGLGHHHRHRHRAHNARASTMHRPASVAAGEPAPRSTASSRVSRTPVDPGVDAHRARATSIAGARPRLAPGPARPRRRAACSGRAGPRSRPRRGRRRPARARGPRASPTGRTVRLRARRGSRRAHDLRWRGPRCRAAPGQRLLDQGAVLGRDRHRARACRRAPQHGGQARHRQRPGPPGGSTHTHAVQPRDGRAQQDARAVPAHQEGVDLRCRSARRAPGR